jgi:hypothetical protein
MATVLLGETFIGKQFAYPLRRRKQWNSSRVGYQSGQEQFNEVWALPIRFWGIQWMHLSEAQRDKLVEAFDACRGQSRYLHFIDPIDYQGSSAWTQAEKSITAVDQTNKQFTISGLHASAFLKDWTFKVTGSTGNDGIYTVVSASQTTTPETIITVSESIPDSTADGSVLRMYFQLYNEYYTGETYSFSEPKQDIQPNSQVVTVAAANQTEGVDYTIDDEEGIIVFVDASTPTDGQAISVTFDFYYRVRFMEDQLEEVNTTWQFYEPGVIWIAQKKRRSTEA